MIVCVFPIVVSDSPDSRDQLSTASQTRSMTGRVDRSVIAGSDIAPLTGATGPSGVAYENPLLGGTGRSSRLVS